jgi:hypothetical protein
MKSDTAVLASHMHREIVVFKMKPFSGGEIIEGCLEAVVFCNRKYTISDVILLCSPLEGESRNFRTALTEA